jgi:diacylglycerol O-acyltransferase / wax synthase
VRTPEQSKGFGNQITFVPVTVPFGIEDPKELLQAVHNRTDAVKKLRLAEMVGFGGTLLGTIPTAFQMFAAPIVSQLPLPLLNFICTNVPGPQTPLFLLGRKMLTCYPYVPIGGEMGMNCAVLTYNGKAFVGFTCDVPATPDSKMLPKYLQESFAELKEAVGIKTKRIPKRRPRKAVTVVTPVAVSPAPEPMKVQTAEPERAMAQVASD